MNFELSAKERADILSKRLLNLQSRSGGGSNLAERNHLKQIAQTERALRDALTDLEAEN